MILTELIGSVHTFIAAFYYSLYSQYKKYLYGHMDVQTITNTFSEDF